MPSVSCAHTHVRSTSSAVLSVSRHLKAHLRCSSVVGLFDVGGPPARRDILRRAARSGLWESATTAEELVDDADERLFSKVRHCSHHVLEELLPATSDSTEPQETAPQPSSPSEERTSSC